MQRVCGVISAIGLGLALAACGSGAGPATAPPVTVTVTGGGSAPATTPTLSSSSSPASQAPEAATSTAPDGAQAPGSGAAGLQQSFRTVRSGVVRFEVSGCDTSSIGSGFAISPTLVVTAAHVVNNGSVIRMVQGTTAVAGTVVGINSSTDVALVRAAAPLSGATLRFATGTPQIGDRVAAIGFPEGDPLSFNEGTVNGLDRKAIIDGIQRHSMIEMDAATTHGSSGGPVINAAGAVVGLVDAGPDGQPGRRLAVSSGVAAPLVADWQAHPAPVPPPECASATGPDGQPVPGSASPTAANQQALATLAVYFRAVNNGDFSTAFAQLLHGGDLATFTRGVTSSQDSDFIVDALGSAGSAPTVSLSFTSHQDPGRGPAGRPQETCTRWSLDYGFARSNGLWLISSTTAQPGGPASRPCG